jgi:glucose dehydrogenase
VSTTIRLYFETLIAVATMVVVAIVCGFIASVIIGDSPPNFPVAGIAFVVTGLVLFLRLWRTSQPALPPS